MTARVLKSALREMRVATMRKEGEARTQKELAGTMKSGMQFPVSCLFLLFLNTRCFTWFNRYNTILESGDLTPEKSNISIS